MVNKVLRNFDILRMFAGTSRRLSEFAVKSGTFASRVEFETWLNDMENITCSNFVTRTSRCTPHGKIVYLRCRFSGGTGAVVDPKVLKRAYRTTVKVHRDCPAFLKVVNDDVPEEWDAMPLASPSSLESSSVDALSRAEDEFNQLDVIVAQMLEEMKKSLKNNDPERIHIMRQAIEDKLEEISRESTEAIPDRRVNLQRNGDFQTRKEELNRRTL